MQNKADYVTSVYRVTILDFMVQSRTKLPFSYANYSTKSVIYKPVRPTYDCFPFSYSNSRQNGVISHTCFPVYDNILQVTTPTNELLHTTLISKRGKGNVFAMQAGETTEGKKIPA